MSNDLSCSYYSIHSTKKKLILPLVFSQYILINLAIFFISFNFYPGPGSGQSPCVCVFVHICVWTLYIYIYISKYCPSLKQKVSVSFSPLLVNLLQCSICFVIKINFHLCSFPCFFSTNYLVCSLPVTLQESVRVTLGVVIPSGPNVNINSSPTTLLRKLNINSME